MNSTSLICFKGSKLKDLERVKWDSAAKDKHFKQEVNNLNVDGQDNEFFIPNICVGILKVIECTGQIGYQFWLFL